MTIAEKKVESIKKEIEKLTKSVERTTNSYNKKTEKCVKLGCDWTDEEMRLHSDIDMTDKQWSAWFDRTVTESDMKDYQERLEHAFKRLERAEREFENVAERIAEDEAIANKENNWLELISKREEEYQKWLAQFKAECLEDGIVIEEASSNWITGTTPNGKRFSMYINNGWTERSFHSYTLRINGATYFTSGLFATGYRYLKAN